MSLNYCDGCGVRTDNGGPHWTDFPIGGYHVSPPPKTAGRKDDTGKPGFDLLPFDALAEVHRVLEFGGAKYGYRNWETGVKWLRLANAAARHLFAWMKGEKADADTGQSHIAHLACCALFLLAHELRQIGEDDRR